MINGTYGTFQYQTGIVPKEDQPFTAYLARRIALNSITVSGSNVPGRVWWRETGVRRIENGAYGTQEIFYDFKDGEPMSFFQVVSKPWYAKTGTSIIHPKYANYPIMFGYWGDQAGIGKTFEMGIRKIQKGTEYAFASAGTNLMEYFTFKEGTGVGTGSMYMANVFGIFSLIRDTIDPLTTTTTTTSTTTTSTSSTTTTSEV